MPLAVRLLAIPLAGVVCWLIFTGAAALFGSVLGAALAKLLRGRGAHVNLIPVNSVRERSYHATRRAAQDFMQRLEKLGIHATVRRTLGSDIEAACGQLRHETEKDPG